MTVHPEQESIPEKQPTSQFPKKRLIVSNFFSFFFLFLPCLNRQVFIALLPRHGMRRKRRTKYLLYLAALFAVVGLVALSWHTLKFSYISTAGVCSPKQFESFKAAGYVVAGQFTPARSANQSVQVFVDSSGSRSVLKHEIIHRVQYRQHRLFGCGIQWPLHYLDEVEAYAFMNLSDRLYERVYGRIEA